MNTSERVNYIKEIARLLSVESWAEIDLTLTHFGFPTLEKWGGERYDYIIEMIQKAKDEKIEELARHLGIIPDVNVISPADTSIWQPRRFRIFISHTSPNKELAAELKQLLEKYYISGFVAHNDIKPTTEWEGEITKALNSAHALVALLSKDFPASPWTDQEVGACVGRGILVIPIMMGRDPYGFIKKYQGLQGLNRSMEDIAAEIFGILRHNKLTQGHLTEAIVSRFEDSWSFDEAKKNTALLEEVTYLSENQIKRVKAALETNRQIYDSFGAPERINALILKHQDLEIPF